VRSTTFLFITWCTSIQIFGANVSQTSLHRNASRWNVTSRRAESAGAAPAHVHAALASALSARAPRLAVLPATRSPKPHAVLRPPRGFPLLASRAGRPDGRPTDHRSVLCLPCRALSPRPPHARLGSRSPSPDAYLSGRCRSSRGNTAPPCRQGRRRAPWEAVAELVPTPRSSVFQAHHPLSAPTRDPSACPHAAGAAPTRGSSCSSGGRRPTPLSASSAAPQPRARWQIGRG
jgi:hypothetical protein